MCTHISCILFFDKVYFQSLVLFVLFKMFHCMHLFILDGSCNFRWYSIWRYSRCTAPLCVPAAELLRTRRGERERWRGGRRGLRDPPDNPPESPRASPAAPDGPRVQLPVSLHPSQRPDQPVLVPRAARAHDVQHAGAGRAPAVQPDALGESRCNPTMHCSEIQA